MIFLFLILALMGLSRPRVHPIVLVPGDGGNSIEGRLNKTTTVHYICDKVSDWFTLWLNLEQLVPGVVDCWVDNMKLVYDPVTHRSSDNPGVETRIPGFGNTSTVEYLDPSQRFFSVYFANLVTQLIPQGYNRGSNLHGAPYDFRKAAHEHEDYFSRVKSLIEETFLANGETSVIILTHSLGSPMMLYFLLHQSKAWKDKYIRAMITLAGPWGGSVRALSIFAVGDNLGNWMLSEKKLMWEQRTSSSLAWLMPQKGFWEPDDVLVQTSSTNYTVEDYQRFFSDLDEPLAWNMREDTMRLLPGLPAPGVEVFCIHGSGVKTTKMLVYGEGEFPGSDPTMIKGDGDGTVNLQSLVGCTRASCFTMMLLAHQSPHAGLYQTLHKNHKPNRTLLDFVYCFPKPLVDMCKIRWATQQREAVHHKEMPGVDHMGILRQLQPAQEIAAIIENLNNQLYEDVKYLNVEDYPKVEVLV